MLEPPRQSTALAVPEPDRSLELAGRFLNYCGFPRADRRARQVHLVEGLAFARAMLLNRSLELALTGPRLMRLVPCVRLRGRVRLSIHLRARRHHLGFLRL